LGPTGPVGTTGLGDGLGLRSGVEDVWYSKQKDTAKKAGNPCHFFPLMTVDEIFF
jgi:hypothetical protein